MTRARLRRRAALLPSVLALALGATACAADAPVVSSAAVAPTSAPPTPSTRTARSVETPTAGAATPDTEQKPRPLPASHVHAVAVDPGTGDVLVATHAGLYVYGEGEPRRVGPTIDLMGFTVAGSKHYLASGHPGAGVDLPQPVGLIESRDGGQSWTVLSRGGSSDFHALAAAGGNVVGFDGALRASADSRTWKAGNLASPPRSLAVAPDGRRILATTADGLMSSTDGGARWSPVDGAPLLLLVDWAEGGSVAGLDTDGRVHISHDGGDSWRRTAVARSDVQAIGASGADKTISVVAATADQLVTWSTRELVGAR